ncbi:MAG TPA: FtsH protease activity modulator HflK [Rhizomicrobium sp.]|nr:FtsH protease activity modulator HflK [Rhizomicrobium sp.]
MTFNPRQGGDGLNPQGAKGPWGREPSGRSRRPDLEELFRRLVQRLRGALPSGRFTAGTLGVAALALLALWLASGVYFVRPDEEGVVLRFGAVSAISAPGMRYHLPWPIEVAYTPKVRNENKISIGFQPADAGDEGTQLSDVVEESHMLTGDENIVDINFTVYWKIKDAPAFLFNAPNQEGTIKAVAESAMREVVGESQIEPVQTSEREEIQLKVRDVTQKALDAYGMGVFVTRVQMLKADPPGEVIAAYRDVQAARADQDSKRNEAEAYANRIVPQARGEAAHIVQDAEAYRQEAVAEASGEAKRFLAIDAEYRKAPEVTRKRLYLETMSRTLGPLNKIIVDDSVKGVVPYLQSPGAPRPPQAQAAAPRPAPPPAFANAPGDEPESNP